MWELSCYHRISLLVQNTPCQHWDTWNLLNQIASWNAKQAMYFASILDKPIQSYYLLLYVMPPILRK